MLKKHKVFFMISCLVTLLPILPGLLLWPQLPEQMPTHFSFSGEVNGYSSKLFAVVGLYLFVFAAHCIVAAVTSADPKNRRLSDKVFCMLLCICPVVSLACGASVYGAALGRGSFCSPQIMFFLLGVMYIVVGNYLPKCRQNYTVGIKVPWTLNSEENWDRTHRFSGKLWIIGGLVLVIAAVVPMMRTATVLTVVTLGITIVPCLYSFLLYRKGI